MIMEGTPPNAYDYGGHPAPDGASPTQPYKCGQYFKIKVKNRVGVDFDGENVGAENFQPLRRKEVGFDFDLNILTAFIRLGRAGPVGAGCPP
jgi:hypothetical protein